MSVGSRELIGGAGLPGGEPFSAGAPACRREREQP
jgi:hypothetical protein